MNRSHHHLGFTLIEMVIVIAIMGIVAAIVIPAYNNWMVQESIQRASGHLEQDISFAEGYAIRTGQTVQVSVQGGSTGCAWSITPSAQNVQQNIPQMASSTFDSRYRNIDCDVLSGVSFMITPTGMVYNNSNTVTSANITFGSTSQNANDYGYWLVQMSGAGNIRNCAVSAPTSSVCNLS